MSSGFVGEEKQEQPLDNLKVLVRFVRSLPLLQWVFFPYLLIMILSSVLPQVFLWVIGEVSKCSDLTKCSIEIYLLGAFPLTLLFVVLLVVAAFCSRVLCWSLFEISGQWAVRDLHASMVKAISHVRTTYFDENPSGRLINRLVKDYDHIRSTAIVRLGDMLNSLAEVISAAAVLIFAHPIAAILILPVIAIVLFIQRQIALMLHHSITLRSIRFSAVLHRETDLIEGARTFLLYGKVDALIKRLQNALHDYMQMHLLRSYIEAWGRFWTSIITALYTVLGLVFIAFALSRSVISEVLAAVMITALLRLTPLFGWLSWVLAYLLESIATIRRTFEMLDLPNEMSEEGKSASIIPSKITGSTLLKGDIVFTDYSMSYRKDSPLILDNIRLVLPYGKKIGVIGRTGAGKTSLMQSLFRMVYVHTGDIQIGGESIFKYGVDFSREHFGVVPQDPYLFAGTIRSNLDREGEFEMSALSQALQTVGLDIGLEYEVTEGGENLSLGQRQLVCLARLIITNVPYIIMDEPTSSVDSITDAKIQNILNTVLKDRTVVTIAHRVDSLIRYDWLVQIENGKLLKHGRPEEVLQ
jgi:ABC-type multidrug transport system fused ATPase/permease subunit